MDVTDQIIRHHQLYGGSDNTSQSYTSSSRSLNYARGASIQKPETDRVTTIPHILKYEDSVGLFGSENHFVKVQLNIQNPVAECFDDPGYECMEMSGETPAAGDPYTYPNSGEVPGQAYLDLNADPITVNTYEPMQFVGNTIARINEIYIKIDLKNLKTGNKFVDNWLDIRLYNEACEEHPYDVMYVKGNRFFYIGFHARNTKRIPYNVDCVVGQNTDSIEGNDGFLYYDDIDPRLLATKH